MLEKKNEVLGRQKSKECAPPQPGQKYMVPRNSLNDFHNHSVNDFSTTLGELSTPDQASEMQKKHNVCCNRCPHCENMAKNFLFLESLLRTHVGGSKNCQLCRYSQRYLKFVNQNIRKVFGNFDSLAMATRALNESHMPAIAKGGKQNARPTRMRGGQHSPLKSTTNKKFVAPVKTTAKSKVHINDALASKKKIKIIKKSTKSDEKMEKKPKKMVKKINKPCCKLPKNKSAIKK